MSGGSSASERERPRVLVLGVGNTLQGDDGAGYCLARALAECGGVEGAELEAVQRLNPGHFSLLEGYDTVVFLDAVVDPDMPPEARIAVLELDPSTLSEEEAAEIVRSTDPHGMEPVRMTVMAWAAGVFRGRAYVVGVRPERIEFMQGLSDGVLEAAGTALGELGKLLSRLGARLRAGKDCVLGWMRSRCRGPLLD